MLVQVVGALLTGSLALLADAAHMFTDSSALVIALIASTVAARPANDRNTYGYQRAEVFGALVNAVILIALMVWIAVEAVQRLLAPSEVEVAGGLMLLVAAVGLVANAVSMYLLSAAQKRSINVRGAYIEVLGDLIGSALVIVAAVVIWTTGWMPADALASLLIAVMILPRAVGLLREVFSVLGSGRRGDRGRGDPRPHPRRGRRRRRARRARVAAHPWRPVFTAHVVVATTCLPGIGGTGALLSRLQGCLSRHFDVEHSTFQFEPAGHREHEAHV
jgi:cobalt-zinc-cadmium efflux system protein